MALANYADLTAAIASWTARSDYTSANYSDFTTLFEAWVNRGVRPRQMETTASLTPVAGVAALPVDYMQWRRLTWTGSKIVELEYVHPTMLRGYYPTAPAGTPAMFTIEGSNIIIRPTDATALELDYWKTIPTLVTNSTNWLMTACPDLYLAGTLVEAYLFNKDPDAALIWKSRRDQIADEIAQEDRNSKAPGAVRIFGATP